MVKIQDKLGELVGGMFRIQLEDEMEFELKPKEKHKRELLFNYKETQELATIFNKAMDLNKGILNDDFMRDHKARSRATLDEQNRIIKDILRESYETFSDNDIENICNKYSEELVMELYLCYGWINKKAYEALKKEQESDIKKLEKGEEKQTNKEHSD